MQIRDTTKEHKLFLQGEYFFSNKSNLCRKQINSQIVEPVTTNTEPDTKDFNRLINQKKVVLRPYHSVLRE